MRKLSRSMLLQLGNSFWATRETRLLVEDAAWREVTERMAKRKYTGIFIELGEGIRWKSHPELAIEGSWSLDRLHSELARLKAFGIQPIPAINFSATHDIWLGAYESMLSTPAYYGVCTDLIREVYDLFDRPPEIYIGLDEEDVRCQLGEAYEKTILRQGDRLWDDIRWLIAEVEKTGARCVMDSDLAWEHPDYADQVPKSARQNVWGFDEGRDVRAFRSARLEIEGRLIDAGYEIYGVPSTFICPQNPREVVDYLLRRVPERQLVGFCQSSYRRVNAANREFNLAAIDMLADIMDDYGI